MRLSKTIAYTAFSLIAVFLIISSASIYLSTEQTAKSFQGIVKSVNVNSVNPFMTIAISGKGKGVIPSSISLLNQTITLNPGQNLSKLFNLPINLKQLESKGLPLHSFTMFLSVMINGVLSVINITGYNGGFSLLVPAIIGATNTSITPGNTSNSASITVVFRDLIPLVFLGGKMVIHSGTKIIGNLSLNSLNGEIAPGNQILKGIIKIPNGESISQIKSNLNYSIGSLYW
ncbi:MAG: hypothetical protein ACYDAO_02060 [Thermoplasmataceae archaeon]